MRIVALDCTLQINAASKQRLRQFVSYAAVVEIDGHCDERQRGKATGTAGQSFEHHGVRMTAARLQRGMNRILEGSPQKRREI